MIQTKLTCEPTRWHDCTEHDWKICDKAANCYSYVLNNQKNYWSQPGMGFIKTRPLPYFASYNDFFKGYTLEQFKNFMIKGAIEDGLIQAAEPLDKEGYYLAALFFKNHSSNFDLHWYRKDDDGTWSHKDGWHAVSNTDNNGSTIKNPKDTVNPDYPIFGSYFYVPNTGIKLTKKFPMLIK